jgi:hypothetical protein
MIGFHSARYGTPAERHPEFSVDKAYEGLRKNATGHHASWVDKCSLDSFYHSHGWYPALPEDSRNATLVDGFEKRQAVAVTLDTAMMTMPYPAGQST